MKILKPEILDGNVLGKELEDAGVTVYGLHIENGVVLNDERFRIDSDGYLYLEVKIGDEKKAEEIILAHKG